MKYTKQYFIDKFTEIPDEEIGKGSLENHCALYHCGVTPKETAYYEMTEEAQSLARLLYPISRKYNSGMTNKEASDNVCIINDGIFTYGDFGDTPKKRILKALGMAED